MCAGHVEPMELTGLMLRINVALDNWLGTSFVMWPNGRACGQEYCKSVSGSDVVWGNLNSISP